MYELSFYFLGLVMGLLFPFGGRLRIIAMALSIVAYVLVAIRVLNEQLKNNERKK